MKKHFFLIISLVVLVTVAFNQSLIAQDAPKLPAAKMSEYQNNINTIKEACKIIQGNNDNNLQVTPQEATQVLRDTVGKMIMDGTLLAPPGQTKAD